jgi:hypothetical protein
MLDMRVNLLHNNQRNVWNQRQVKSIWHCISARKCELNYIRDGEDFCDVCKREMKRAQARGRHVDDETEEDEVIMCTECGKRPPCAEATFAPPA